MNRFSSKAKNEQSEQDQIISYKTLRILMVLAGIFLPLLVFIGKAIAEKNYQLEFSISDYYNNSTGGDLIEGILFALSFFLFAYKGPEPIDNKVADIGSVAAVGVALFPTTATGWVHYVHFVFAIILFVVFIIFSLYLFRKSKKIKSLHLKKEAQQTLSGDHRYYNDWIYSWSFSSDVVF